MINAVCLQTSAGDVLVSVNPYKKLALYTLDVVDAYKNKSLLSHLPPHMWVTQNFAYSHCQENENRPAYCEKRHKILSPQFSPVF